jgi:hypothetical protein
MISSASLAFFHKNNLVQGLGTSHRRSLYGWLVRSLIKQMPGRFDAEDVVNGHRHDMNHHPISRETSAQDHVDQGQNSLSLAFLLLIRLTTCQDHDRYLCTVRVRERDLKLTLVAAGGFHSYSLSRLFNIPGMALVDQVGTGVPGMVQHQTKLTMALLLCHQGRKK